MQTFNDYEGREIRLPDERLRHISDDHPELAGLSIENTIRETLANPDKVLQDAIDEDVRLYFRFYYGIVVGDKHMKVVVVIHEDDAFISTMYPVSEVTGGAVIWERQN